MRLRTLWSWAALGALAFSLAPRLALAAPVAAPLQQANLLTNPDMENFNGGTAAAWDPWWEEVPKPGGDSLDYVYKPDWVSEANPTFVKSGSKSQHIGRGWDPWHAGIR